MLSSRRDNRSHAAVLLVWLLLCANAGAAPIFIDDFESGAITAASGGKWGGRTVSTGVSLGAETGAKRRGSYGFRLSDGNGTTGERVEGQAERSVTTSPTDYYMRYWFRMTSSNNPASGAVYLSQLCSSNCSEGYGDIVVRSNGAVVLEAKTASTVNNGWVSATSTTQLVVGTWYLFEVAANNLRSSSNGRVRLFVNGQLAAERTGLDYSNKSVGLIVLGEPWANGGTYTGYLDFDDVYVDDAPLPSRLRVEAPPSVATGTCVPLTFSLRESSRNALAPAPYNVSGIPVGLSGATAALYSNDSCTSAAVSTVSFPVDTDEATLYLKATTTGTTTIAVGTSTTDFLPGQTSLTVMPGAPPPALNGTSCSSNSQCSSNFCVDGVCCDTACNAGSCDACSVAQGALSDGTCRFLPAGTVCRGATSDCDAEERCTGDSGVCPNNALLPAGTVCRGVAGPCDLEEVCSGTSALCPVDGVRSAGSVCRSASEPCDVVESCDGGTKLCPADAFAPSELVCSDATSSHEASNCSGTAASCPIPKALDSGTVEPIFSPPTTGPTEPVVAAPVDAPEAPSGPGAIPLCEEADCVSPANVGCSCQSAGDAGVLALLAGFLLLVRERRCARRV